MPTCGSGASPGPPGMVAAQGVQAGGRSCAPGMSAIPGGQAQSPARAALPRVKFFSRHEPPRERRPRRDAASSSGYSGRRPVAARRRSDRRLYPKRSSTCPTKAWHPPVRRSESPNRLKAHLSLERARRPLRSAPGVALPGQPRRAGDDG
jgi:hypothetical protein